MDVLAIDDDLKILNTIQKTLLEDGIGCYITNSCEKGLDLLKMYQIDLVILDLNLPDKQMNGFTMINTLRKAKVKIPIIIISGNSEIQEKIKALDTGADDYLVKPFDGKELLARVKRHVFRSSNHYNNKFIIGELELDTYTQTVIVNKGEGPNGDKLEYLLDLTKKEYDLMELFMSKPGMIISKDTMLQYLYHGTNEPHSKITDVLVCKLRKEIAQYTDRQYIYTSWSRGYTIKDVANNNSKETFLTLATKHKDNIEIEGLPSTSGTSNNNIDIRSHNLHNKNHNQVTNNNEKNIEMEKNFKLQPRKLFA